LNFRAENTKLSTDKTSSEGPMMIVIANFIRTSQVADSTNIYDLTFSGEPDVAH
jgi:hypothetical protein